MVGFKQVSLIKETTSYELDEAGWLNVQLKVLPAFNLLKEMLTYAQFVTLHGGRKGGKTEMVCDYILYCCSLKRCNTKIFLPQEDMIDEGMYRSLIAHIEQWGFKKLEELLPTNRKSIKAINKEITLTLNGVTSVISFDITNSNPQAKAKGISYLDLVILEEAQMMCWDFFTYIEHTLREDGAKMIALCNLQEEGSWMYNIIKNREIDNMNKSWQKVSGLKTNLFEEIYMPWYDNHFLSEFEINRILSTREKNEEEYQIHYMNEYCPRKDLLIYPNTLISPLEFETYVDIMGIRRIKCESLNLTDTPIIFYYGYDRGTVHNAAITQNFVIFYPNESRMINGKIVPTYDIFTNKAIIKPIKSMKEFYFEVENWMPELLRDGNFVFVDDAGKNDDDSEIVLQFRSGEYGVPFNAKSVGKGSGSVQNGIDFIMGARNWYINPKAEYRTLSTGQIQYHWDNIYHEKTHYMYKHDTVSGSVKYDTQGKPVIDKINDDFMDSVRYSTEDYRKVKQEAKNREPVRNRTIRKYKPYGNIG